MRSFTKRLWAYTSTGADFTRTYLPSLQDTHSSMWYHNIHELPLWVFIKCQLEKNVNYLIRSGNPSIEELEASWASIVQEFHEAIGDDQTTMRLFVYKEMALLAIVIREIHILIYALRKRYVPFFHKQLDLLCECELDLETCQAYSSAYHNVLDRYEKRAKMFARELKLKEIEYAALENGAKGKPPTLAYYDSTLITLTDFAKVPVTDQVNTFTYCERVRRLNEYCKKQNKK